jgi:hypothetical protein
MSFFSLFLLFSILLNTISSKQKKKSLLIFFFLFSHINFTDYFYFFLQILQLFHLNQESAMDN